MENNGQSVKVRLWLRHTTEYTLMTRLEDLLNTSAVISKTIFEQRRMLFQDDQPCGPKKCQDCVPIVYTLYYKYKGFADNFKRQSTL